MRFFFVAAKPSPLPVAVVRTELIRLVVPFAEVRLAAANARSGLRTTAAGPEGTEIQPLVAHALSKELQLYFDRLTTSALVSGARRFRRFALRGNDHR